MNDEDSLNFKIVLLGESGVGKTSIIDFPNSPGMRSIQFIFNILMFGPTFKSSSKC